MANQAGIRVEPLVGLAAGTTRGLEASSSSTGALDTTALAFEHVLASLARIEARLDASERRNSVTPPPPRPDPKPPYSDWARERPDLPYVEFQLGRADPGRQTAITAVTSMQPLGFGGEPSSLGPQHAALPGASPWDHYGVNAGNNRGRQPTAWDNPDHRHEIHAGRQSTAWDSPWARHDGGGYSKPPRYDQTTTAPPQMPKPYHHRPSLKLEPDISYFHYHPSEELYPPVYNEEGYLSNSFNYSVDDYFPYTDSWQSGSSGGDPPTGAFEQPPYTYKESHALLRIPYAEEHREQHDYQPPRLPHTDSEPHVQIKGEGEFLEYKEDDGFHKVSLMSRHEALECIHIESSICEKINNGIVKAIAPRLGKLEVLGVHKVDAGAINALAKPHQIWSDIGSIDARNIASRLTSWLSATIVLIDIRKYCVFDPGGLSPSLMIFDRDEDGRRFPIRCAFDPGENSSPKLLFVMLFIVSWFPP